MKNKNINTIIEPRLWEEIVNYKGKFIGAKPLKDEFLNQNPAGTLTLLEKKALTVSELKFEEAEEIIKSLWGKGLTETDEKELGNAWQEISSKITDEQSARLDKLSADSCKIKFKMYELISSRLKISHPYQFRILPDFTVITGISMRTIINGTKNLNHIPAELGLDEIININN